MILSAVRLRWLRLRHGWPVRFAHHPLCARHACETWRLGRLHLCRGCVSLAGGLVAGSLLVLGAGGGWCVVTLLALGPFVIALSWPPFYRRLPRWQRDLLRFGTGLAITLSAWVVGHHPRVAWPLLPILGLLWWWYRRARQRSLARRCEGCPERNLPGVCTGFALHAACLRTLEAAIEARMAPSQLSGRDGCVPPWNPGG